ncbi:MAG: hypothetical protein AB7S78_09125 [Candidatus Omnitrophota bacterium]
MKKFITLIALTALIFTPALSHAASGQAVVGGLNWTYTSTYYLTWPFIQLSNVTGADIDITIKIYDESGSIVTDGDDSTSTGLFRNNFGGTVTNWDDNPTGASMSFTLAANSSVELRIAPSSSTIKHGYAIIEWDQDSSAAVGLVGIVRMLINNYYNQNTNTVSDILINEGKPF